MNSKDQNIESLAGIRNEITINELCCRDGIDTNLYYKWSRDFKEIAKGGIISDANCDVITVEVKHLKNQNVLLKQLITELRNENYLLKKKLISK